MSRPNTCTAQPTTDRDDRGDTYRGRTRGPVYSDKRSGVSKRPRRHLSAREGTRGSDGNPRHIQATDTTEATPTGGRMYQKFGQPPAGSDIRGDTYRQKTALVTIDVQHQWSSASGHAARAQKRQSGDATKGSKTTQVPNCCRMINSL